MTYSFLVALWFNKPSPLLAPLVNLASINKEERLWPKKAEAPPMSEWSP